MNKNLKRSFVLLIIFISLLPYTLNVLGIDFSSTSIPLNFSSNNAIIASDQHFYALTGALHHALLEWSAVTLAIIAGVAAFIHYYQNKDISIPIIGLALLCAGMTDAFHTLAATRIISATVPNGDFIPFTWAFSRLFNASIMIVGVLLSLWLTRPSTLSVQEGAYEKKFYKNINQTQTLVIISIFFIVLAISAVILAATSQHLPQTTFSNAFITRPYDVVPLALFILSAVLVWFWYQRKASILKFSLLLSLIPEVITQLHMSFGSTALFDNHFNIAHFLKIVAYAILTLGILITLVQSSKKEESDKECSPDKMTSKLSNRVIDTDKLLDVGQVKYSQVLVFSSFTFILAITISIMVSSIYYVDAVKVVQKQEYKTLKNQGDFIELLLKNIYQESKDDLVFLSKMPPIQGMVQSLNQQNKVAYDLWYERLNIIFSQILQKNKDYLQVSYVNYYSKKILLKSEKHKQQNLTHLDPQLEKITNNLFFDDADLQNGRVLFFNDSFHNIVGKSSAPLLHLFIPIYDESNNKLFGLITLQVNFSAYLYDLKLTELSGKKLFLADYQGHMIYKSKSLLNNTLASEQMNLTLQQQFPNLTDAVATNREQLQLGMDGDLIRESSAKGHYRTINLLSESNSQVILLFIQMDQQTLFNKIATVRNRSLQIGFGLAIVALAIALLLSRRLSSALKLITSQVTQYSNTGKTNDLPINALDESGVLARSFHNLLLTQTAQEKALLQQQRALDEHAIVSITDIKGNITYFNDKFMQISGYSEIELLGKNHRILNSGYHDKDFFTQMYKDIAHGKTWQGEICNKAKDGHLYWVNTTIVAFMNSKGRPESYVSIRTDITSNKHNSEQLLAAKIALSEQVSKLKSANVDLNQFAYVASHDLKSPLNGISQLVSWLEEDCHEILPEESQEHLKLLKNRSKRMIVLLNDLLEYSRAGRTEYQVEVFNLAEVVNDIFDLHGNRAAFSCIAQDINLSIQKAPFELVIRNLISNAIKHHDKDGGIIEISAENCDEPEQSYYVIRVQDDGPGIPVSLHDKALEMFQTLQSRDKVEGSGMGLALVKKTVQHHGGTISIDPSEERGTLIIIKWPYTQVSE